MTYEYVNIERENDPHALPDVEIYELVYPEKRVHQEFGGESVWMETGWYYQYGFPGCLPESDPFGPFDTAEEALEEAREYAGVEDG